MVAVPFPSSSTPGRGPGEGEGRLRNIYVEKGGDTNYWRRLPGLFPQYGEWAAGEAGPRGSIDVNGRLYIAYANALRSGALSNASILSGVIPGTDGVTFAANNRVSLSGSTPDLVAVRESGGAWRVDVASGGFYAYSDPDLPLNVNSVSFLGGFLLFTVDDGRIFASELNSTDINALSFATAESLSDGLLRGIVTNGRFVAFGKASIEFWLNQGLSPFPLARATSTVSVGLLTTMAVAGFGEGWDRNPYFVANDGTVRELAGYSTRVVSTPDVEAFIAKSTISTLEANVYTFRGRSVWSLSSDKGTWELETTTGFWHERESYNTSPGPTPNVGRWRGSRTVKSGGRWVAADYLLGDLLALSEDTRTENGLPITWQLESAPLREFPSGVMVPDVEFYFTATAGATALIFWSVDGGETWSQPVTRALRPDGNAKFPVRVNTRQASSHHGMRFRIAVSEDVDFSFMGAAVPGPQPRAP